MDTDRSLDICMLSRGRIGQHFAPELLRRGVPITTTDVGGSSGVVHTVYRRTPGCISGISPGNLAQALLVYLTGRIGWPDFGRMCGVDGTAQADGEPFGS
jgi:hypothetical protein